jgi:hypothetical protein
VTRPLALLLIGGILAAADLPVREVTLYKNGVGYFRRAGELPRGESVRLDFRDSEMGDVLKSLIVRDASGAPILGVRYDSAEPLDRKLADFPFQLTPNQTTSAFLDQMRGARLEAGSAKGSILGARVIKGREGEEREQLTLLADDGQILNLDLAALSAMRFEDAALQQQLKDYLATLTASRSRDRKSIYLDAPSDKARSLSVSYMAPAPAWKSSYRLLLTGAEPVLEGWAIVDNTTPEDWTNVKLSLVSGRPVSFLTNLYQPRYVERETAELAEAPPDRPMRHSAGVAGGAPGGVIGGIMGGAPPATNAVEVMADTDMRMAKSSRFAAAEGGEAGELFEYRFPATVTVRRNESAMLPFLQQGIKARKLLIWTSGINPRNAAEIDNTTGKTLDGGPITVFDGASYAGEALMDTVKQGDKRLISYAVDLGTRVTNNIETGSRTVREFSYERGILSTRVAQRYTTAYTIRNVDAKAKTLWIEHPLRGESKILGTQPVETTPSARRFEVALKPSSEEKFVVTEEVLLSQTNQISSYTPDQLIQMVANRPPGDAARKIIEEIAAKKRDLDAVQSSLRAAETESRELDQDSERTRRNLQSLAGVPGQQEALQRYSQQLAQLETRIAELRQRQTADRQRQRQLEQELNALLERLKL